MIASPSFALISREVDSITIPQRADDGYINATALCRAVGKLFADYRRLSQTGEFFTELAASMGIPIDGLTITFSAVKNEDRGTWIHPQAAIHLAQWCSPKFAVLVSKWVTDWLTNRTAPALAKPPTYAESLRLAADAIERAERLELQALADRPKVALHDALMDSEGTMLLSDAAKVVGMRPREFFIRLTADRIIFFRDGANVAAQEHIDNGRLVVKLKPAGFHSDGSQRFSKQTRVTGKGLAWLQKKYAKALTNQ